MVPAGDVSPAAASTGTDSPVIMLRSTADSPDSTSPSAAIFSPARPRRLSPRRSWPTGMRVPAVGAEHARVPCRRPRPAPASRRRRAAGPGLIPPAGEQERRDRGRHLEVDAAARGVRQLLQRAGPSARAAIQAEHRVSGPAAGGDHAQGHQGVHRGRAVPGVLQGRAVKGPRGPQRDRRGQRAPAPTATRRTGRTGNSDSSDGQVAEQARRTPARGTDGGAGSDLGGGSPRPAAVPRRARPPRRRTPRPRPPRSSPAPGRLPAPSTVACSVAKLTAATTPGATRLSFFSTRAAHAVHVIPRTDSSTVRPAGAPSTAGTADTSSIGPPIPAPIIGPKVHAGRARTRQKFAKYFAGQTKTQLRTRSLTGAIPSFSYLHINGHICHSDR